MEMAKVRHPKTEKYCEKLWNKNIYGDWEEYQRMAILFSLNEIKSAKLLYYIEQAKKDGRKYLLNNALKLEMEIQSNNKLYIGMKVQEMNLNIRYDAPKEIWDKVQLVYQKMEGWLGYGDGKGEGESGIPYWFSFNESEKHILASVEPGGLHFSGLMVTEEWNDWSQKIKILASDILGYKVGEIELGEIDF